MPEPKLEGKRRKPEENLYKQESVSDWFDVVGNEFFREREMLQEQDLDKDRTFILKAVKEDGMRLEFAHETLRDDSEIVLAAVKQSSQALQFAGEGMKSDQQIVSAALRAYSRQRGERKSLSTSWQECPLRWAAESLKNDREFILRNIYADSFILEFVGKELQNDSDIVLAAFRSFLEEERGMDRSRVRFQARLPLSPLRFASEQLRADREFILQLADELEVCVGGTQVGGAILAYASKELQADREIVLAIVEKTGAALQYADPNLRDDEEIVSAAIARYPEAYIDASEELRGNDWIAKQAVSVNGMLLGAMTDEFRDNESIVSEAIWQNPEAIRYVSERLQKRARIEIEVRRAGFESVNEAKKAIAEAREEKRDPRITKPRAELKEILDKSQIIRKDLAIIDSVIAMIDTSAHGSDPNQYEGLITDKKKLTQNMEELIERAKLLTGQLSKADTRLTALPEDVFLALTEK